MCSDDARTRAEGIFEVSIRRDSVYALVLESHCVMPFVFAVKLARDDDSIVIVVSSLMVLMTDQAPNVSQSCEYVFVVSLCGINVIVYTRKVLRRHLHKSTWFYVIITIKRMRKQWIPGALFPLEASSAPGFEASTLQEGLQNQSIHSSTCTRNGLIPRLHTFGVQPGNHHYGMQLLMQDGRGVIIASSEIIVN